MSRTIHIAWLLKYAVLTGILLLLFVPLIQDLTQVKTYIDRLNGSYDQEKDTSFNWKGWFSGGYQTQKEKYLNENFGLRNYYFRLHSQLKFELFKKANAAFVVVGKDNYLFETAYFDAYYGRDFIGKKKIESYMAKLKCIQDTLEKMNKLLVVVLAPGKASYYPEYIPRQYKYRSGPRNYDHFAGALGVYDVNHIDFNKYFIEQKEKSPYPLYPQYGIHWSNYGSTKAFDSLTRYVESKLDLNLPDIVFGDVTMSDSLRNTDNDVIKGMNLIWEPKSFAMAYRDHQVIFDSLKHKKPSLLVVADSFWWYIYSTGLPETVFTDQQFWFYNEGVYPQSYTTPLYVLETDYFTRIRQSDVIVIMYSEPTLARFGDGFIDMCYEAFCEPGMYKEKLQRIKRSIRATEEWYNEVVRKAAERNLSVDSMLTLDAIYMLKLENQ